ncbi:MAG: YidC/Oxa1 family membrane protein insertase [Synergistaceae bacterium]|nr:YidC/Oxa1 family membrane protein insertase [Synergistaceae bacterium]MDD2350421.1 YidC/Oxa1 family membrane protein insertase [Synergistaceae bacterium]MDD3318809.1 YidC/Oxa1 family membrane protein insertase [Synergistaceae bacterium]MDD3671894.1 YidC/Oxa1 family membrane protein insertase [Synergistaceae bacterium]MDD3963413.1 YidC/Oxa1 family membrane protein insertase [Synergistaceae bacterium]
MGAIWNGASELLLMILEFFYGLTNSFGLAIVLLTVAVRIVLYPLNQKQMTSMQQMQKIQPRLKVLQEKYANDKEKLNQETMRLYKENKVNPAAGCLPLLVQLPILILLFNVLRTYDFAGTSFLGIILGSSTTAGLAQAVGVAADPTGNYGVMSVLTGILKNPAGLSNAGLYIGNLILLIGISFLTWAQQKLSSGTNPQMAMMNTIMPFFMAFICLSMPGGVMLYWGLSSLMGVVQQYFVMSKTKQELQVKPALHKNKPTSSTAEDDDDEYEDDDYEEDDDDE